MLCRTELRTADEGRVVAGTSVAIVLVATIELGVVGNIERVGLVDFVVAVVKGATEFVVLARNAVLVVGGGV
jgi:hypothetical protein